MLTAKQKTLLIFIQQRLSESGVSPSFDEMKDALGLKSKSGIHRLITALEERGFLRRLPNRARALEVVRPIESNVSVMIPKGAEIISADFAHEKAQEKPVQPDTVSIPLHGKIAAGTPIEALERSDSYVDIPPAMLGRGGRYALEVSGDSMIEMGIMDGDTVVIESCRTARDGDVVVALVDGEEATLKTFRPEGPHIALVPANRDHRTQILEANRVQVQGRLVGLLRTYH